MGVRQRAVRLSFGRANFFFGMKGLGECIMEPTRGRFVELLTLISFSPHAKMTSAIRGKISLLQAFS